MGEAKGLWKGAFATLDSGPVLRFSTERQDREPWVPNHIVGLATRTSGNFQVKFVSWDKWDRSRKRATRSFHLCVSPAQLSLAFRRLPRLAMGCFSGCRRQVARRDLAAPWQHWQAVPMTWESGCRPRQLGVRNRRPGEAPSSIFPLNFAHNSALPGSIDLSFCLASVPNSDIFIELPPQAQNCPDSDTQPPPFDQGQTKKGSSKLKLGLGQNSDGQLPKSNHRDPAPCPTNQFALSSRWTDLPSSFPTFHLPRKFYSFLLSSDSISESHLSRPYLEQQSRQILGNISFGLQHQS